MFVHRLQAVADSRPDALAMVGADGGEFTYGALLAHAHHLAAHLERLDLGAHAIVGLGLPKSPAYLVGLLGTWLAGYAFVPLDPALPPARLARYGADAAPRLVLVEEDHARYGATQTHVIDLNVTPSERVSLPSLTPDALAYILFSSGSTGAPKGICVAHRGLCPMLDAQIEAFGLGPDTRALWLLSIQFDASLSDLGTTLLAGGTLVLPPPTASTNPRVLMDTLRRHRITAIDLPPSLLPHLPLEEVPASLRTVVIGGEVCKPEVARRWARRVRLINVYGPTEATVCTSLGVVDPDTWGPPLLGDPLPGVTYRVLGPAQAPADVGELFIGGDALALGYLHQPRLTAERFVEIEGQRVFATGDRVRHRRDGQWVFEGRIDRQLKVQGRLVAPEEIEAALTALPEIGAASIVADSNGELVAMIEAQTELADLPARLAETLPTWMVPRRFLSVDALPRTATGKPDIATISEMLHPKAGASPMTHTALEAFLVGLWTRALGRPAHGGTDFFAAGGTSLGTLQILAGAQAAGLSVTVERLRAHPSPSALTIAAANEPGREIDVLRREATARFESLPPALPGPRTNPPAHILLTGATGALGSRVLARLLETPTLRITALVRGANTDHGRRRLERVCPGLEGQWGRVRTITGDLAHPQLGLSAPEWHRLATTTDTIVHCAAHLSLAAEYDTLAPTNVGGTTTLLHLARTARPKALHFVSTLSVFVDTDHPQGHFAENDPLGTQGRVHGGYAQTKWVAEALATAARATMPINLYRLGLLTGDAQTGRGLQWGWLGRFIRALATLGALPDDLDPALAFDFTPVDYAANALGHFVARPLEGQGHTYHLCGARPVRLTALVTALERHRPIEWCPRAQFDARLRTALGAPHGQMLAPLALGLSPERAHRALDVFRATHATFDDRQARGATGLVPPPGTEERLAREIEAALRVEAEP